jgi:hypothetical protein
MAAPACTIWVQPAAPLFLFVVIPQQNFEKKPAVTQYPGFSPFGINGGFYCAKVTFKF